jgi:hypothetical protein
MNLPNVNPFSSQLRLLGGSKGVLLHLALVAVFGVFLPWKKGIEFFDPVILSAYACLGVLFAAPIAAQAFADVRPESMSAAIARIAAAVLYGECVVIAFLGAGIATVYFTHRHSVFFAPDLVGLGFAALLGLTGSFAFAALAAWISLRFSAAAARGALRMMFLLLLFLFFFRSQWLPDVAEMGALLCLGIGLAAMFGIRSQLR